MGDAGRARRILTGKRLRRITPAYGRQLSCLPAAACWLVVCTLVLFDADSLGSELVGVALAGVAVVMLRLYRIGVYLGPRHVRVRTLLRTVTVPAAELRGATTEPRAPEARPDAPDRSDRVVLRLSGGRRLPTPVRVHNPGWERQPFGPVYPVNEVRRVLALVNDLARGAATH